MKYLPALLVSALLLPACFETEAEAECGAEPSYWAADYIVTTDCGTGGMVSVRVDPTFDDGDHVVESHEPYITGIGRQHNGDIELSDVTLFASCDEAGVDEPAAGELQFDCYRNDACAAATGFHCTVRLDRELGRDVPCFDDLGGDRLDCTLRVELM